MNILPPPLSFCLSTSNHGRVRTCSLQHTRLVVVASLFLLLLLLLLLPKINNRQLQCLKKLRAQKNQAMAILYSQMKSI